MFQLSLRFLLLTVLLISGCAITPHSDVRGHWQNNQAQAAIDALETAKSKDGKNALLYHMEKGLILHHQGEYQQSSKEFHQANALIQQFDYLSVSEQTGTLLANDWAAKYKGEYSERLWIHSYQMMNFLLLGDFESAAVEARQSLQVLDQYPDTLENDGFTRALIALSFESVGKINDAYIVYKNLGDTLPNIAAISPALEQHAKTLGFYTQANKHRANSAAELRDKSAATHGELILFISSGHIAEKTSTSLLLDNDLRVSFPKYRAQHLPSPSYQLTENGSRLPYTHITTALTHVAQQALDKRGIKLLAKSSLRASLKHNVTEQITDENELAGALIGALFFILEEADTRSWTTLPAHLSIVRVPLKAGVHTVVVTSLNGTGKVLGRFNALNLVAGQKAYRVLK